MHAWRASGAYCPWHAKCMFSAMRHQTHIALPMPHQQFQQIHFSSDQYPQSERVDAFREEVFAKYMNENFARLPGDGAAFFHRAAGFVLGGITLGRFVGVGGTATRTPQHVADGNDNFVFRINKGCTIQFSYASAMGGKTVQQQVASNTSGVLCTNGRAGEFVVRPARQSYVSLYSIIVPRTRLLACVPDADAKLLNRSDTAAPLIQALLRYADELLTGSIAQPLTSPEDVGNQIFDLVCMILGPNAGAKDMANRRSARAIRLAAIADFVKHSFFNADLNVSQVAAYLGTTERHVQKLLEECGTTFSHMVLEHRLEAAAERLSMSPSRPIPINMVATECGFNNVTYFNRVFKRRFEMTPREYMGFCCKSGVETKIAAQLAW